MGSQRIKNAGPGIAVIAYSPNIVGRFCCYAAKRILPLTGVEAFDHFPL